jgi:hypothetical protein
MKKVLLSIIMLAMLACGKEEVTPELPPQDTGIWVVDEYKGTECISGKFIVNVRRNSLGYRDTAKVFVLPNLNVIIKHDSLDLNKRLHKFGGYIITDEIERTTNYDMHEGDLKVYNKGIGEGLKTCNKVIFSAQYAGDTYHDKYNVYLTINSDTIEYVNELK